MNTYRWIKQLRPGDFVELDGQAVRILGIKDVRIPYVPHMINWLPSQLKEPIEAFFLKLCSRINLLVTIDRILHLENEISRSARYDVKPYWVSKPQSRLPNDLISTAASVITGSNNHGK